MELSPKNLSTKELHKLMTSTIMPRPIGWISSIDEAGHINLAPFSFFNIVCPNPPHVLFCPGIRRQTKLPKDTLTNVKTTGEFVVNIVTESLAQAMNTSATELPPTENEFELAGLTALPSVHVKPPRVAESPINYECRVVHIYEVGQQAGNGSVVIGEIVHIHVNEAIVSDDLHIEIAELKPIGLLRGSNYCRVTDQIEIPRPAPKL
ncbi:flavin reductase family protein [Anaerolineales bacterium HSG25]|nr:flavin reductase family protein [Anaerolineales bacterium HSG25]